MRKYIFTALAVCGLAACTTAQQATMQQNLASQPGQLFCSIVVGSTPVVMGVVQAATVVGTPGAAEAMLATGATSQFVQNACQQAAKNVGAPAGVPVSPPANPAAAPAVAVDPAKVTS